MSRTPTTGLLVCALLLPASLVLARGGGGGGRGGGGPGGGGMGGGGRGNNPFQQHTQQTDPQQQAEQTRKKVEKMLSDGFAALKASDTAAALEDFSDVLQLAPDDPMGHLGMGLVRAQKGRFGASQSEFTLAVADAKKAKADLKAKALAEARAREASRAAVFAVGAEPKTDPNAPALAAMDANLWLANYDLAVSYSRATDKGRAMVLLDRMISEDKTTNEMLVNAQRSVLAALDEKARSSIAAMPSMLQTLETAYAALRSAHAPLRRWGVAWMASEEVSRRRLHGEAEPLPRQLPFLLPEGLVLPEVGQKALADAVNPLDPVVSGDPAVAAGNNPPAAPVAVGPAAPAGPAGLPGTSDAGGPGPGAAATPPAPPALAVAGGAGDAGQPVQTPAPRRAPVSRTVSGAAFAVSSDVLVTCDRFAAGARSIHIESTDGNVFEATLLASDEASGLALIRVEGGHFTPLALADAARPGAVTVAAFSKPAVFGPEISMLRGELGNQPAQPGQPASLALRAGTHPRSAGSPVTNDKGQVVAVFAATRDDPPSRLPVVGVEAVRRLAAGKVGSLADTGAGSPEQSTFEVTATRED